VSEAGRDTRDFEQLVAAGDLGRQDDDQAAGAVSPGTPSGGSLAARR